MKEEEHLTAGRRRTEAHRGSAAWARDERSDPVIARNLERSVLASAIDDDYLVIHCLLTDRVEQRRERAFFIQSRDDYRNHFGALAGPARSYLGQLIMVIGSAWTIYLGRACLSCRGPSGL